MEMLNYKNRLIAVIKNVRQVRKRTNALAYLCRASVAKKENVRTLTPDVNVTKHFFMTGSIKLEYLGL
jgi:hypothetical protein